MKVVLKLEEFGLLILGIYMFGTLGINLWILPVVFFVPDLSMLGYVRGPKTGGTLYNVFHHKGIGVALYLAGVFINSELLQLSGIVLFSHSCFDRMLGYGLKYERGFRFTHLGEIGSGKQQ